MAVTKYATKMLLLFLLQYLYLTNSNAASKLKCEENVSNM